MSEIIFKYVGLRSIFFYLFARLGYWAYSLGFCCLN